MKLNPDSLIVETFEPGEDVTITPASTPDSPYFCATSGGGPQFCAVYCDSGDHGCA